MKSSLIVKKLQYYTSDSFYAKKIAELKEIEEHVAYILLHYPETRDKNINMFLLRYWATFTAHTAIILKEPEFYRDLPDAETIRRTRQKLQNTIGFCPPSDVTKEYRAMNQEAFHDYALDGQNKKVRKDETASI